MLKLSNKRAVGLDIADRTLEVVELTRSGKETTLKNAGRTTIKSGSVVRGRIKNADVVGAAIKKAFAEAKPEPIELGDVVFGLPESQVYTRVFFATVKSEKLVADAVQKEIEKNIPVPIADLVYDTRILSKQKGKTRAKGTRFEVLIVAVERDVLLEWQQLFASIGITHDGFDAETFASARGLFASAPKKPVCVVDMGAGSTSISIFDKHGLQFSFSSDVAGDVFTQSIARTLKVKKAEADKLKKTHGVANPEEKTFTVLVKQLEKITKDITSALAYFKRKSETAVEEIILIGGSSQLKGVDEYLGTNLKVAVKRGESFVAPGKQTKTNQLFYVGAIGLALRNLDKKRVEHDPLLPIIEDADVRPIGEEAEVSITEKVVKQNAAANSDNIDGDADVEFLRPEKEAIETPEQVAQSRPGMDKKLIALILIIVLGAVALWLAFMYRADQREMRQQRPEVPMNMFQYEHGFSVSVPVAIDEAEHTDDRVEGRIIEVIVEDVEDGDTILNVARELLENEKDTSESVWALPLNNDLLPEEFDLIPVTVRWLVYDTAQSTEKAFTQAQANLSGERFEEGSVAYGDVEATDNSAIYMLTGTATLHFEQPYVETSESNEVDAEEEVAEDTESASEIAGDVPTATVLETSTGWLRVRAAAGTEFSEVDKINPGETYEVLDQFDNWVKIKLDDVREGWVHRYYVEISE